MKKLAILMMIALFPVTLMAQSKTVDSFISKYKNHDDVTFVVIKGSLFNLIASIAEYDNGEEPDEDLQALGRIADGIQSMTVLQVPYYETDLSKAEVNDLRSSIGKEKYEEFIQVKEGKELINVMAQGTGDEVKNGLILIEEKDEFTIISVDGTLSIKDLNYLSKHHKDWH